MVKARFLLCVLSFQIGSHTVPGQHSQPTPTPYVCVCVCVCVRACVVSTVFVMSCILGFDPFRAKRSRHFNAVPPSLFRVLCPLSLGDKPKFVFSPDVILCG